MACRLISIACVAVIVGCASTGRSTRLTHGDFNDTVHAMAASLATSDFITDRTSRSPPIRIVTNKVENLSSDVISPAEQWMLIARVQTANPVQELAQKKRIVFQIPPEEIVMLQNRGFEVGLAPENAPTHLMTATIMSSSREGRDAREGIVNLRKDYYLIEFTIIELAGREKVWTDAFEIARQAAGLAID